LQDAGQSVIFRDVHEDMRDRDRRDRERSTAPLKAAEGAMIIDTTGLDADSVFTAAVSHINIQREQ
jgi:cytidylate kinase